MKDEFHAPPFILPVSSLILQESGGNRVRTGDPELAKLVLCQLSYAPVSELGARKSELGAFLSTSRVPCSAFPRDHRPSTQNNSLPAMSITPRSGNGATGAACTRLASPLMRVARHLPGPTCARSERRLTIPLRNDLKIRDRITRKPNHPINKSTNHRFGSP